MRLGLERGKKNTHKNLCIYLIFLYTFKKMKQNQSNITLNQFEL